MYTTAYRFLNIFVRPTSQAMRGTHRGVLLSFGTIIFLLFPFFLTGAPLGVVETPMVILIDERRLGSGAASGSIKLASGFAACDHRSALCLVMTRRYSPRRPRLRTPDWCRPLYGVRCCCSPGPRETERAAWKIRRPHQIATRSRPHWRSRTRLQTRCRRCTWSCRG